VCSRGEKCEPRRQGRWRRKWDQKRSVRVERGLTGLPERTWDSRRGIAYGIAESDGISHKEDVRTRSASAPRDCRLNPTALGQMVEVQKEGRTGGAICPGKVAGRRLLNGLRDRVRFGASGNGAS
jgi:hypothetical protein